jgi:cytochrome c-type biogenesis protein CcmH/NrfG
MHNSLSLTLKCKAVTALISLFIAWPLLAQTAPEQKLAHAYAMEREGHPDQAKAELQVLLAAKSSDAAATGKAWNILALAYEDQGNYVNSQHAYERSIRTPEGLPNAEIAYSMYSMQLAHMWKPRR